MCAFHKARLAQARERLEELDQEVDKLVLALQQAEDTVMMRKSGS